MSEGFSLFFKQGTVKRYVGLCLLLFAACKFNPNIQGEGEAFLQGIWEQDSLAYQDELLRYTQYHFKFTCDSVYITLRTTSKVKTEVDSCFGNGTWKEYAKGVYLVRNDSLLIEATFTHPNWKQKLSGCYRVGQYLPRFKLGQHRGDSLSLFTQFHHEEIKFRKIQDISCIPKPL